MLSLLTACALASAAAAQLPSTAQMIGAIQQVAQDYSYPRFIEVAANITYGGFTDDVVGRLDPTETYKGNELATEYMFGFAAECSKKNTTLLLGYPVGLPKILSLITSPPVVFTETLLTFNFSGSSGIVPVMLDTQWSFNAEGKITGWDITIRHFALLMEKLSPSIAKDVAKELGLPAPAAQDTYKLLSTRAALDICAKHEAYCAPDPALKQWTSYDACVAGILAKPFGQWYQMGGDNAICRWIHHGMVQYRPSVHCAHIGPTGGDMCQAIPYETIVTSLPFKAPFIGAAELALLSGAA